jgi:hypothetical protein
VHGSTLFFKLDQPLYRPSKVLTKLTGLPTLGSPVKQGGKVSVNVTKPEVFTIRPVMLR